MFGITYWQSNKRYKERHHGQSMPWCPHREREEMEDAEERLVEEQREKEDLKESMIRYHEQQQQPPSPPRNGVNGYEVLPGRGRKHVNLQNDENEPPVTSHLVRDLGNGVVVVDENPNGNVDELASPEYPKRYNV